MADAKNKVIVEELIQDELKSKTPKYNESSKVVKMEKLGLQDLPGVGAATAEKLEADGFRDLLSVAVATLGELVETAGVTEAVARKMINAARDSMKMGFETGMDVLRKREGVSKSPQRTEMTPEVPPPPGHIGAVAAWANLFYNGALYIRGTILLGTVPSERRPRWPTSPT